MSKTFKYHGIDCLINHDAAFDNAWLPKREHIRNFIDMVAALRGLPPPEFEMCSFMDVEFDKLPKNIIRSIKRNGLCIESPYVMSMIGKAGGTVAHTCRTSACALGTAAYAGIGSCSVHGDWGTYSQKTFGFTSGYSDSDVWNFLFSDSWSGVDNTPEGAAARVLYLITNGFGEVSQADRQSRTN